MLADNCPLASHLPISAGQLLSEPVDALFIRLTLFGALCSRRFLVVLELGARLRQLMVECRYLGKAIG